MKKVKPRKAMDLEDKLVNISPKRKKHGTHIPNVIPSTIGDRLNIAILLFLYTLQGVPLGLSAAIPIIMQKKHITYKEQVIFCNNYIFD
jgi:PAT family acetyl-CoA transporter-like MFS transporter 1